MPTLYEQWATNKGLIQPPQQPQQPQGGGNFLTGLLPTAGGIGGSLAGAGLGASIGSIVPGVGTVIGGLLGGVLGGAAGSGGGKVAENAVEGQSDLFKGAGEEALMGGLFSAPPIRLAKGIGGAAKSLSAALKAGEGGVGAAAKTGFEQGFTKPGVVNNFLKNTANKMYTQAFTVPRRVAKELKPEQTARELINYGIGGSLDNISSKSQNILGKLNGLLDNSVTDVGGQIKVGEVTKTATDALKGVAISGPERKAFLERITDIGTKGVLPGYAAPSEVLDTIRDLESRGFNYIHAGSGGLQKSPKLVDIGDAYVQVAREMEDSLYGAINKSGSLKALQTPQAAAELNQLAPGLGDKFLKARDAGDVRTLMAPFVNAKKLANITRDEAGAAGSQGLANLGLRVGGAGAGLLAGGPVGAGIGLLAAPVVRGVEETVRAPVTTAVGRGIDKLAGRALQPGEQATGGLSALALRQGAGRLPFADMPTATPPPDQNTLDGALMASQGGLPDTQSQNPYPLENLLADVQRDPANQDEYYKTYQMYQELFKQQAPPKLSATQQTQANNATIGLQDLSNLADMIGSDSGLPLRNSIAGFGGSFGRGIAGTTDYEAARQNIIDTLAKLRSGAAITASEEKRYTSLLPEPGDNSPSALSKLQRVAELFQRFANPRQSASLEDALVQQQ